MNDALVKPGAGVCWLLGLVIIDPERCDFHMRPWTGGVVVSRAGARDVAASRIPAAGWAGSEFR